MQLTLESTDTDNDSMLHQMLFSPSAPRQSMRDISATCRHGSVRTDHGIQITVIAKHVSDYIQAGTSFNGSLDVHGDGTARARVRVRVGLGLGLGIG